ncbi:hypothetical protein HPB50_014895 [Hyalomma asiaticum]|uniref:Uncharacterized protein n=1 Tax=Hyalomma asiaticum TaxID=266040 RepID=A0ACB7T724_HYAAI|nr:hypothetical protein HPB50_014895 [Hyalomma asiaticum]
MEDFLSLDFDTSDCSWKLWDGIEQEPCYFDGLLELDFVSDLGLCTSSSDDTSLGLSPLFEAPPVLTNDCCEQQLQVLLPESEQDTSPDTCDVSTVAATPLDVYDIAPAFPKARSQAKATSRNAARERSRVRSLRSAFQALQSSLPSVPPNTKLSKLDILVLASNYIAHLGALLSDEEQQHSDDQLQVVLPQSEADTSPDTCDVSTVAATPLDVYDIAPAFPKARSQAKATSRNAARERSRVRSLRSAFQALQSSLPSVPPNTKLSKLDILVLASNYIAHLGALLSDEEQQHSDDSSADDSPVREVESTKSRSYLHPVKKWPMRSRLYAGAKPYADDRSRRQANDFAQAKKSSKNAWRRQEPNT